MVSHESFHEATYGQICPACDNTGLFVDIGWERKPDYVADETSWRGSEKPQLFCWACHCPRGERWMRPVKIPRSLGGGTHLLPRLEQHEMPAAIARRQDPSVAQQINPANYVDEFDAWNAGA